MNNDDGGKEELEEEERENGASIRAPSDKNRTVATCKIGRRKTSASVILNSEKLS